MEADLQAEYQVDLAGLYTGAMTPRRCWLLIEQLPPGSRLAMAAGGAAAWSTETHAIVDMLTAVRSDLAGKQVQPPKPPEPGWLAKERAAGDRAADRRSADARRAARIAAMDG